MIILYNELSEYLIIINDISCGVVSTTFSSIPGPKVTYDGDDRSMYLAVGFDAS